MSHRFFIEPPIAWDSTTSNSAVLEGPEAHHLLHVMRLGVGDRLTLFDGTGAEFAAEISETSRRAVTLAVPSREMVDRELSVELTLGVAMPKGDRQKVLVEKLTELGVTRLVPLMTEHSVVALKGSALEKLRRLVIESSKQCGRNRLMAIEEPMLLGDFLSSSQAAEKLFAHPNSKPFRSSATQSPQSIAIAVGPEGGFSAAEEALAQQEGWRSIGLGKRILRIETAAITLAAMRAIDQPFA